MSGYFRLKQSLVIRIAMHSLEQGHRENRTLTNLFLLHSAYTASLLTLEEYGLQGDRKLAVNENISGMGILAVNGNISS